MQGSKYVYDFCLVLGHGKTLLQCQLFFKVIHGLELRLANILQSFDFYSFFKSRYWVLIDWKSGAKLTVKWVWKFNHESTLS